MKRRQLSIFLLVLAMVSAAFAQKPQIADATEQNLRKHVEYLASEKLEGRRTGEQGATYAAGYVANTFAQYKLKPGFKTAKTKPNFLQPFPYVAGVTLGPDNLLRIIPADAAKENKMEVGVNWMPLGYSPNADIPPSDLVFTGYGITSTEPKYDDYAGLDVKDKIVLIFDGTPDATNPHTLFGRFNIHTKASIAKDKGARAIVVIASDSDFKNDGLSRLVYDRSHGETAIPVVGIMRDHGAELLGAKDAKELDEIEKWLAMKTNAPPNTQAETRAVASVPSKRPELKAVAQLKINLEKRQVEAYNVIGILEGRDPVLKNEAIIIGAHYDHLGKGGQGSLALNSSEIHYGADDNASGMSAVLELARQFAKEKSNKRTIIFMAFGGEEEGLLGSKYYVNNPVWPLDKTVAMINLDMVGRLNEERLNIGGVGTSDEWRTLITSKTKKPAFEILPTNGERNLTTKSEVERKLRAAGIPFVRVEVTDTTVKLGGVINKARVIDAVRIAADMQRGIVHNGVQGVEREPSSDDLDLYLPFRLQLNEDGFGPSDHSSFYAKQIPVLFFFTGTHADYHKPSDTAEKINYDGLTRITSYVSEIVKSVDQNPTKPTYTLAKSSGGMGGRTGFNVSLGTVPSYADSTDGLVLDGVRENSPAAKAGIKAGDKIVKLAGKEVRNAMDYTYVLGTMKAGEEYEVELLRGNERLTLKIVPAPATRR